MLFRSAYRIANRINLHLALGGSFDDAPPALVRTGNADAMKLENTRGSN